MANRHPSQMSHTRIRGERRRPTRHHYLLEAPYRLGEEVGTALLHDLSTDGAGMVLPHQVVPGMMVGLELHDPARHCWRLKLAEVVHVTRRSPDEWVVGSRFTRELSREELEGMLQGTPAGNAP